MIDLVSFIVMIFVFFTERQKNKKIILEKLKILQRIFLLFWVKSSLYKKIKNGKK